MTAKKKHPRSSRVPGWQGVSVVTQVWRNQKGPVIRNRADHDAIITACGRLCLHRKRTNISTVLAGQKLGIKEVDEGIWLVTFMHYDLGYFDLEQKTCNPSTTRSARGCHPCLRYVLLPMSPGWTQCIRRRGSQSTPIERPSIFDLPRPKPTV